ncbi:MAG TPA: transposase [Chloroflexota bacterium]|nr:transposase [Chloroflexota bacterium]
MKKVAQRRRRSKAVAVSGARQRAAQRAVQAAVQQQVQEVVKQAVEAALAAEVTALLGRARYTRRRTAPPRVLGAACSRCGLDWTWRGYRDGHYRRTLLTLLAAVEVRVPRLRCCCGGTIPLAFATVGRYERGWGDVQERARELAGLCVALADARTVLAWTSGQPVAMSTLQRWDQQAAAVAEALRQGPLARVPPVVLLDGRWLKLFVETGEHFRDRQGRERPRVRCERAVLLVAYGVDPVSGERWLVDWERAAQEDQASWQRLLERLQARGLQSTAGFTLFVHDGGSGLDAALNEVSFGPGVLRQRCVFHVLRTVRDAVRGTPDMTREAKRARRQEVLAAARTIWDTTERETARRRLEQFAATWRAREPAAVAALERAFEATLGYCTAVAWARERGELWAPHYLRTTSALERVNRALRQKARQVGAFHAEQAIAAAVALVAAHRHLAPTVLPAGTWTDSLEEALLVA